MNTIKNLTATPGSVIMFGGTDCVVLDVHDDKMLVITKEAVCEKAFDENNKNNFNNSTLRTWLNTEFVQMLKDGGADVDSLVEFTIDLTSDDGLKDYGVSTNKVALLTCDLYRQFRSYIPNLDSWWWLATPYSTESNGYDSLARYVTADGGLDYYNAYYGYIGVRPAFVLPSSIFESRNLNPLEAFSTEELLKEVLRRNAECH